MSLICQRTSAFLITLWATFFLPTVPHAAEFQLRPIALTGDQAPEGGAFTQINGTTFLVDNTINNVGEVAFAARVDGGDTAIYVFSAETETISRIIQIGDPIDGPDPCGRPVAAINFSDQRLLMSDAREVVFHERDSFGPTVPVHFTGTQLFDPGCPVVRQILDTLDEGKTVSFRSFSASAITSTQIILNVRTLYLDFNSFPPVDRAFLISGETVLPLPLTGTQAPTGEVIIAGQVVDANDSGDLLVRYDSRTTSPLAKGYFLESGGQRIPIAVVGGPGPNGTTFNFLSSEPVLNDSGEVYFAAELSTSGGRGAIVQWAPDRILTTLIQEFDLMPGGGVFRNFIGISVNDRGDMAFVGSGFPGGIFVRSAEGEVSKIIRQLDPVPEGISPGTTFSTLGLPKINNKRQIEFGSRLSNGVEGIFLASTGGPEIEFVDPVPDLLVGPVVTSDPVELATKESVVTGIAADGVARVIVRVKTEQAGEVEFSIVGEGGASLPASNLNGRLSQLSEPREEGASTVVVDTVPVEGVGPMAFAVFHAPLDFVANSSSPDADLEERQIAIKATLVLSPQETVQSVEPLRIVRPPVILMHGLWDNESTWDTFTPLVRNPIFYVETIDYDDLIPSISASSPSYDPETLATARTSALGFTFNANTAFRQMLIILNGFRDSKQVAAIQTDVVAHSMGGNVTRNLALLLGFFNRNNFDQGLIHRLVTIGTPHLGSPLATQLLDNENVCVRNLLAKKGSVSFRSVTIQGRTIDGGVSELRGAGVLGGTLSPALRAIQNQGDESIPTAVVAGRLSQEQLSGLDQAVSSAFIRLRCSGEPLADSLTAENWPKVFGQDSDGIVPLSSQLNGLHGPILTAVHSSGTVGLGFGPPHELEPAADISRVVVNILNTALMDEFFPLLP